MAMKNGICVQDRCIDFVELTEICAMLIISFCGTILGFNKIIRPILRSKIRSFNESYIVDAIRIWSMVYLVCMIVGCVINGRLIDSFIVHLMLVLSGLAVDKSPYSSVYFLIGSSFSWYGLLDSFLNCSFGDALLKLVDFSTVVGFVSYTSVVFAGHLPESKTLFKDIRVSLFLLSLAIFCWSCMVPLEFFSLRCLGKTNVLTRFAASFSVVPLRLREMGIERHFRFIYLALGISAHLGTYYITQNVDNVRDCVNDDVEISEREAGPGLDDIDKRELPGDCIEISLEDAIKLQEGTTRIRKTSKD